MVLQGQSQSQSQGRGQIQQLPAAAFLVVIPGPLVGRPTLGSLHHSG